MTALVNGSAGPTDPWRVRLGAELPVLDLPADRPRTATVGSGVRSVAVRTGPDAAAARHRVAHQEGTTPAVVGLAAYAVFLAHMTRQRDLVVGGPGALPLRLDLAGRPTFRDVVRQARDALAEAQEHTGFDPAELAAEVSGRRIPGVAPLFQACFSDVPTAVPGDVDLALRVDGDLTAGELAGRADLFDAGTVERFAAVLAHLLDRTATEPDEPVFARPPLPPAERERMLHGLHRYARPDVPWTTMAQPFEEQVRRSPDAQALVGEDGSLTYAELNARANRLARHLRGLGARPGAFVAVSMDRSLDLMVALYAVAKSGAAYVPVDPELPDARLAFVLEDCAPVAVLADARSRPRLPAGPRPVLAVDADAAQWAGRSGDDVAPLPGVHLIHMLYTSGTTGRPKGVAYPVDGALADIAWLHHRYPYGPGDTAVLKTSYGFDVSIWEIFWPLYHGARVVVCPPGRHRDPAGLRDLVDRHGVTTMFMVPTMMPPFYDHTAPGSCPSLRWVFCGGEAVTPRVRDGFHERFPTAAIINCYGPTELGCVAETVLPVEPGAPVVVGPPPPHRRTYVLDDHLQPTPIGVAGELYVGGEVGIAQSYHRRPGLTAERFLTDPYGLPGARMYRTGDLCRYRADGVLEHLGRIGRQVKIRGMRVELAEIEAVLAEHDGVAQCVVTVRPDRDDVAAFVVPAGDLAVPDLLAHASSLLPAHMLPSTLTVVDDIPVFVHGKVDVDALLRRMDRAVDAQPVVAPATGLEAAVHGIYCGLLGRDAVEVTESFFALGGHSLLVLALIERCTAVFGVELSITDVLAALSVRRLAAVLGQRGATDGDPA